MRHAASGFWEGVCSPPYAEVPVGQLEEGTLTADLKAYLCRLHGPGGALRRSRHPPSRGGGPPFPPRGSPPPPPTTTTSGVASPHCHSAQGVWCGEGQGVTGRETDQTAKLHSLLHPENVNVTATSRFTRWSLPRCRSCRYGPFRCSCTRGGQPHHPPRTRPRWPACQRSSSPVEAIAGYRCSTRLSASTSAGARVSGREGSVGCRLHPEDLTCDGQPE